MIFFITCEHVKWGKHAFLVIPWLLMKHQRQERRQVQVEKVKEKHVSLCLSPTPGHRTWELLSGQQVRTAVCETVWALAEAE